MSLLIQHLSLGLSGRSITLGHLNDVHVWWTSPHSTQTNSYDAYGYDGGADYYSYSTNKGSLDPDADYVDGGSTTRTISSILWSESEFVIFSLNGTSIPDTDTTFVSVVLNGIPYLRDTGATYVASQNGGTHWYWGDTNPFGSTAGTYPIKINI